MEPSAIACSWVAGSSWPSWAKTVARIWAGSAAIASLGAGALPAGAAGSAGVG
jgi:hypothetical protein